jgi:DNA-directed RNA polymerase specialized sigma24 family protein
MSPSIDAVDELARNASSLRALARDLVGDPALADDALQQAGLAALQSSGPRTSLGGWLRRVVRNCALDLNTCTPAGSN